MEIGLSMKLDRLDDGEYETDDEGTSCGLLPSLRTLCGSLHLPGGMTLPPISALPPFSARMPSIPSSPSLSLSSSPSNSLSTSPYSPFQKLNSPADLDKHSILPSTPPHEYQAPFQEKLQRMSFNFLCNSHCDIQQEPCKMFPTDNTVFPLRPMPRSPHSTSTTPDFGPPSPPPTPEVPTVTPSNSSPPSGHTTRTHTPTTTNPTPPSKPQQTFPAPAPAPIKFHTMVFNQHSKTEPSLSSWKLPSADPTKQSISSKKSTTFPTLTSTPNTHDFLHKPTPNSGITKTCHIKMILEDSFRNKDKDNKEKKRRTWTRMTPELFMKILKWETTQKGMIKQSDVEKKWNVNRTTYYRWKLRNNNLPIDYDTDNPPCNNSQ